VLLIFTSSMDEMLQKLDNQVVDGVLAKPLQQSKLLDAVSKVSGRSVLSSGKFKVITAQLNPELLSQIRGSHLLLVEDNEINRQVAQELLEGFGLDVTTAENGEEAIAMLQEAQFDGVLMDMQMPVMDGVTATREIRKDPRFSNLPIIALTANVMVNEQNKFLDAGITDNIGKPIDPDRLVATLAKWVRPTKPEENAPAVQLVQNSSPEPLPDLPGVNVAESVRRIGGKVTLYYSLLDKFLVDQRDFQVRFRNALTAQNLREAEMLAHTLRGVAGTLGAESLQELAAMLENSTKNDDPVDADALFARVVEELAKFMASIDRAIEARRP